MSDSYWALWRSSKDEILKDKSESTLNEKAEYYNGILNYFELLNKPKVNFDSSEQEKIDFFEAIDAKKNDIVSLGLRYSSTTFFF